MHIKSFSRAVCAAGVVGVGLLTMANSAKAFAVGDIFASIGNGEVQVYSSSGTLLQTLNTGTGGFTTGGVFDTSGNFYVTDFSAGQVSEFNSAGTLIGSPFATTGGIPESIVRDMSGNFYVSDVAGSILKLNSGGTVTNTFAAGVRTDWIDLSADQHTILYTDEGNAIHVWNTATNTAEADFATGLTGSAAYALRILSNGDVLVADSNAVDLLSSTGTLLHSYTNASLGDSSASLFALNIASDGTSFYTGDFGNGDIYHVDIASGAVLDTIHTGILESGTGGLFGLTVFGEITQGGGGGAVPDGGNTLLLLGGAIAALAIWKGRGSLFPAASRS